MALFDLELKLPKSSMQEVSIALQNNNNNNNCLFDSATPVIRRTLQAAK